MLQPHVGKRVPGEYRAQSLMVPSSYDNPYATYKLRGCRDSKSRVSERPEKDYTQTLI